MLRKLILVIIIIVSNLGLTYAQTDSCKVVLLSNKQNVDTTGINEFYQTKGIYLLQNGIYNFKIDGKKYQLHRILKIWNDSITIAWATDSLPSYTFSVQEIEKVTFPSLNNGVTGFPHPVMTRRKYNIEMVCRNPYKLGLTKICQTENCDEYKSGYLYMTSGYGWKPVYNNNGVVEMIDGNVIHKLAKQ